MITIHNHIGLKLFQKGMRLKISSLVYYMWSFFIMFKFKGLSKYYEILDICVLFIS